MKKLKEPHYRKILWRLSIADHEQIKRDAAERNISINRYLTLLATGKDPGGYHAKAAIKESHPLSRGSTQQELFDKQNHKI
jgi:hypothetical protein